MAKIELEAFYPFSIEKVWTALTEPESLAQWIMSNEGFKPVKGQQFIFKDKPVMTWKGVFYCEVLEVEKPNKLSWLQGDEADKKNYTVTFTLKAEGNGTRLNLTHEGFKGLQGKIMHKLMTDGWKVILGRLETVLKQKI